MSNVATAIERARPDDLPSVLRLLERHGQQPGPDGLAAGTQDGCSLGLARRQMRVNVLDGDRRLIH